MRWRVINSGEGDGAFNMALDEAISAMVRQGSSPPTLRLYGWEKPWVSIGSLQKISEIDLDFCHSRSIQVVRRPTGGRGVLHGRELTYSFSSRNEGSFSGGLRESYRQLSEVIMSALCSLGLKVDANPEWRNRAASLRSPDCFQALSFGEVSVAGRKVVGSAQRRWPEGFLQQGSIPYRIDYEALQSVFRIEPGTGEPAACAGGGYLKSRMSGLAELIPDPEVGLLGQRLVSCFESHFRVFLVDSPPSPQELEMALHLAEANYRRPEWTLKRALRTRS